MLPRLLQGVLSACALLAVASCSLLRPHFERPEISVAAVELKGGNLLRQAFVVRLHVQNPNDRDLPVRSVHADLSLEGDPVASGLRDQPFTVPAQGAADVDIVVTANLLKAVTHLGARLQAGVSTIDYEVSGAADVDRVFAGHLTFRQGGSFPFNLR